MRKDWWQICVVPVFSWWFVDVGNVISAHTNDIAGSQHGDDDTRAASETSLRTCRTSMFGMECVADDVESRNVRL